MQRRLEAEWLDHLAPNDPRAVHSRRDLCVINAVMRNAAIVREEIGTRALKTVADIGTGDGAFMLRVAAARPSLRGNVQAFLVDRSPSVNSETLAQFYSIGWRVDAIAADAVAWLEEQRAAPLDAMIANLVLHHFDADALARLLALAATRTRLFIACEPRRDALALAGARFVGLLGCNDVTRHDAAVSVGAGFTGRELSALWPKGGDWDLREERRGLFSHCFVAQRRGR